jgi:hypothetical protein
VKKFKKDTRYVSVLTVHVSSAEALIDMMRYDSCFPASEADSHKIERLMRHDADADDHIVRLKRVDCTDGEPTIGRWRSFNCTVLDWRNPDSSPLTIEEARNLLKIARAK